MKITNKQLKQIIKEEMDKVLEAYRPHQHIRSPEFDSRSKKNYPEYEDKLTNMYMDPEGRSQAKELAGALDEPIDIPIDASRTEEDLTFPIFDKSKDYIFKHRISDTGIESRLFWDSGSQQYVINYQIPYDHPSGAGGQGGFINYDDYQEALKAYNMGD